MGRKIAVRLLLLVLLLAALYGQQEIFAREDSQGTHAEREDTDDLEGGGDEDEQTKADTDHSDQEGQEETEQEQPRRGMEMTLRRSRLFRMRFHMGSRTGKSSTIQ